MELSRTEYPSIVTAVPASPAVRLLRERLQKGQALNNEIAEWLQDRRRADEAYSQALLKLAKKQLPSDNSDLGVFTLPWADIVESTTALANSHLQLAQKLETEVERPIREFVTRNSEWAGMKTMETNLGAAAKAIDMAEERTEKLRRRGQKAKAQQVAEAAAAVSNAQAEWDSQAPFVFEKLQAADESRCNGLRDALTRLHTLELDHAQISMQAAEAKLSVILDISTSDEIKSFASKATYGRQKIEKQISRSTNHAPHPSTPSIVTDDSVSVQSSGSGGGTHGGLGLKRLGTVLRNRSNRNSMFHRAHSPERKPKAPAGSSRQDDSSTLGNSLAVPGSPTDTIDRDSSTLSPLQSNGNYQRPLSSPSSPPASSGGPPSVNAILEEPRTDSEGYTIPPPPHDLGTSIIHDQGPEEIQPHIKVEIKDDVIQEEEEEAGAALSKVANTLRAQNTVSRKTRGRRDVRSTKLFPNAPELTPDITGSPPLTPMRMTPRPPVHSEEAGSDTHSIRSARSVTSLAAAAIRHPDLTEPGLSASIVETVSISFEAGLPTKSLVAGEIAFAYHAHAGAADEQSLTIRMDNFVILEKVAPNPAFVSAIPDRDGEYTVLPQNIRGTAVAFKYQVHLDDVSPPIYAPIIITPVWRLEPHQSSVIINWRPNPDYRRLNGSTKPITLHNVVFVVGIEGANTSSCQSKPMGTFSRERGRIAWKLGDLVIDPEQINGGSKVLARFATDGLAKSTPVEVRWEILGEDADCVGSGLTLSALTASAKEEEADPFADTTGEDKSINGVPEATGIGAWAPLAGAKKVASGKYIAS